MKVLFITRKYPPSVGGMEKVSYHLVQELKTRTDLTLVAWGGSSRLGLPWFLASAFLKSLAMIPSRHITHIHLGDGVLAPLGVALKALTGKKLTVTVHGLDVTYDNIIYRLFFLPCLKHADRIICISEATKQQCIKRGIDPGKCSVIGWGINKSDIAADASREDLERIAGMPLNGKRVLVTVGRLVKRKGVAWFVSNVTPQLGSEYVYLVVGDGTERQNIADAIADNGLGDRVKLLGRLSDDDVRTIYGTADVFVMPNIRVEGDMEGFGIVAIEAVAAGMRAVLSNVEGIADAVRTTDPAIQLVSPEDSGAMAAAIMAVAKLPRPLNVELASWSDVGAQYIECFQYA